MKFSKDFIKKLKKREEKAFIYLYEQTRSMLLSFINLKVGGNMTAAEDILSEVYHDAIIYSSSLTTNHNIVSWLYRIARSKTVDYFRKMKRENALIGEKKWEMSLNDIANRASNEPLSRTVAKEEDRILSLGFSRIPEIYQKVLTFKYIEEKKVKEIAQMTGKTEKTIESILFRGRKLFEKELKKASREKIYIVQKGEK
jgi:RNA polymerase sigma factor (sigma-70 family)